MLLTVFFEDAFQSCYRNQKTQGALWTNIMGKITLFHSFYTRMRHTHSPHAVRVVNSMIRI